MAVRVAAGEGLREVARAAGASERRPRARASRALVPIRGFLHQGKSALRPPHPFLRPRKPRWRRMVHPSAPRDNALQLPTSEGDPARGMPGTRAPREPGAQRPQPRRRRLTFLMLAPGPSHMDFYNLTSPWPRAAGRSRSRRRSRSPSEPEREEEEEVERGWEGGHGSKGRGRARGRAGLTAEGAAPAAVLRRALARRCQSCALPGPPPGRSARSPARPDSHSQHSRGAAGGAGAGTRAPPRGAAESAWPRAAGGLRSASSQVAAFSKHLVLISSPGLLFSGTLQRLPGTPGTGQVALATGTGKTLDRGDATVL